MPLFQILFYSYFFGLILFGEEFLTDRGTQTCKICFLFQIIKHFQKYSQLKKWALFGKAKFSN